MARFVVAGDDLVLDLTGWEKVEGFHGNVNVPLSSVRDVKLVDDPWAELRGVRAPGTGGPA